MRGPREERTEHWSPRAHWELHTLCLFHAYEGLQRQDVWAWSLELCCKRMEQECLRTKLFPPSWITDLRGEGACITQWSYEPFRVAPAIHKNCAESDRTRSTGGPSGKALPYSRHENPTSCVKQLTDMTLQAETTPPAVLQHVQHATGEEWNGGNLGSLPGSVRSPGEGNGNALKYSCLENSMGRGAWKATYHAVRKSWTWLSNVILIWKGSGMQNVLKAYKLH